MPVVMAEFRAKYPRVWLPAWLRDVEVLERVDNRAHPNTQAWVAAIRMAMGATDAEPLDLNVAAAARQIRAGFGTSNHDSDTG